MIHNLSYPEGSSVNDQIPEEWSAVRYANICNALDLVVSLCDHAFMAKTDVKHAFRVIPLHPDVRHLFLLHWQGEYYVDLALPMGCSSSCSIFEAVSTAVEWIARYKLGIQSVHILDDFFLASISKPVGSLQLESFLKMCEDIGLPMAPDKTFWPANVMTFVGYEIDTMLREVRLPFDKVEKCKNEISKLISRNKATLREIQSLVGLLNFACAVILPGRSFLRRLIDLTIGMQAPYHYKRLTLSVKEDLHVWLTFLKSFNGKSIFLDNYISHAEDVQLFTDASGKIGYGAICKSEWFNGLWSTWWLEQTITLKELYPIVLAVELWGHKLANKRFHIRTDNKALVQVINKQTSKEPLVMILVRRLVLHCLKHNVFITASHIPGTINSTADALSRFQMERFKILAPHARSWATPIPQLPEKL